MMRISQKVDGWMTMSRFVLLLTWLALLAGCGGSDAIEGIITFDGKPMASGSIRLTPIEGGPTAGAAIEDGKYSIENLAPGRYKADIVGFEKVAVVTSSAELQRMAEANERPQMAREIGDDAVGNGVEIEIVGGSQTHDFKLMPASR